MNMISKIWMYFYFKLRRLLNPIGDPSKDRVIRLSGKKVKIGAFCYGFEDTKILIYEDVEISFGRYCSIASGLKIFTGGNHRPDWLSTFPFGHMFNKFINCQPVIGTPKTNGNVIIGNDVWIGRDVTIMSGVNIGSGAVIAANSHVIKDVHPYAIVGGNPAKVIKYRFSNEIVQKLLLLKWWDCSGEQVLKMVPYLCSQINEDVVHNLNSLEKIILGEDEAPSKI